MTGREIRDLVIVKMEEYTPFGDTSGETLLAGDDLLQEVKPVYSYVDKTLPEAANEALLVAPIEHLTPIAVDPVKQGLISEDNYFIIHGDDKKFYRDSVHDDGEYKYWATSSGSDARYLLSESPKVGEPIYDEVEQGVIDLSGEVVGGVSFVANVDDEDDLIGSIAKPADYLRLHTLQMAGWKRPVHGVMYPDNIEYAHQYSPCSRGNADKPVVVDLGDMLLYFSQSAKATKGQIKAFRYIPMFDLNIDYPLDVAEMIALRTAAKLYEIYTQKEQADMMAKAIESVFSTMKL